MAYRDARQVDSALDAINKALASAPNNPELYHLKGQILWIQGGSSLPVAVKQYEIALSKSKQINPSMLTEIRKECSRLAGRTCAEK